MNRNVPCNHLPDRAVCVPVVLMLWATPDAVPLDCFRRRLLLETSCLVRLL